MKMPHLWRVDAPPEEFAMLFDALREQGMKFGWLDFHDPQPRPTSLENAARHGTLRSVGVGPSGTVAVKPVRGEIILKDLLREHFSGCRIVLAHGRFKDVLSVPLLSPLSEEWQLTLPGASPRNYTLSQLIAALRRPALRPGDRYS